MTALEAYDLITSGRGADFARVVSVCETVGSYCLIGGLAVNCYVEPVYSIDADFVVAPNEMSRVTNLVNALPQSSDLRTQFTTDPRYQDFPSRSLQRTVLGVEVQVACLEDVTKGKLWAWSDPARRLSKRKKDELDLIRIAESYSGLKPMLPPELIALFGTI
jgi:hypothetical protein